MKLRILVDIKHHLRLLADATSREIVFYQNARYTLSHHPYIILVGFNMEITQYINIFRKIRPKALLSSAIYN